METKLECLQLNRKKGTEMLGVLLGIAAAVAVGALVAYAIALTMKWITNKVREKMAMRNVKKTAVADIEKLIDECDNKVSMEELEKMADKGYSHVMVSMDSNNEIIGDVEIIKDTNDELDREVRQLLGREHMVVIEG